MILRPLSPSPRLYHTRVIGYKSLFLLLGITSYDVDYTIMLITFVNVYK